MAIKDLIGPGFVGTATVKWIVTRGLTPGAAAAAIDDSGLEFSLPGHPMHYHITDSQVHYTISDNKLHITLEANE